MACVLMVPAINAKNDVNKELQKAIKKEKKRKNERIQKRGLEALRLLSFS